VAKANPDGYTLLAASPSFAIQPGLAVKLPYDPIRDSAPVTMASASPYLLVVNPALEAKSVKDLVALAKANPGKLDYGSAGVGGFGHISAALFEQLTGTQMVHIPYKGAAPATPELMAGQIQILFNDAIPTMPHMKSGRLRALAVTSIKRMQLLPDLPTIDEAGVKGYDNSSWMAMAVPAATPKEVVTRLNSELSAILKMPDVQEKSAAVGAIIVGGTPDQFSAYLKSELAKFERVVKQGKIPQQ
jgi:tripartite-type tricarboxylate transporter receptor subunit TctC